MKSTLMMLLGLAKSQNTCDTPLTSLQIPYDSDLKCSMCISGGYNFCFRQKDGFRSGSKSASNGMTLNMKYGGVCCQDATCREMIRPGYRCSASYGSPEYALYMCPER